MELTEEEVADIVTYQIGALKGFCDLEGVPLNHVKVSKQCLDCHGRLLLLTARSIFF